MTSWTFGPNGKYTATWDGVAKVTVTQTSGGAFVASFGARSLQDAITSPVLQDMSEAAPGVAGGLTRVANTDPGGFALQNATPTIVSWTAPADGQVHRVLLFAVLEVTTAETGGQVIITPVLPDGTPNTKTLFAAGQGAGIFYPTSSSAPQEFLIEGGSTFSVSQNSALTAGAAVVWAEIWAL